MTTKMLIDAAHPEETRVVVLRGNRVEEFDFESANRRPLRGNIYLAKVTRVEPSLQAAFVDFGGNRHGFLAFAEIHPDYYQIPTADRMALLAEEAEAARSEEADDDERARRRRGPQRSAKRGRRDEQVASAPIIDGETGEAEPLSADISEAHEADLHEAGAQNDGASTVDDEPQDGELQENKEPGPEGEEFVEQLGGGGDAMEEVPMRAPRRLRRQYKIQEVIKRRQILLVQVVKEERGNKGAALTTYLSLAGRYSVLMPNTARGGGISRKITNSADRKRLKDLASDLEVPEGMGVILRTAGASRTKAEVKRDFEYLMRLWESVRSLTLESTAPALVYEEGSLIKRAIRDLYSKDIEDIQVAGEDGYREAKDFMRMLMPSHAKNVQPYREVTPLFTRMGVESQLDAMFSNNVTLKSGGYIVINPTEALVSIDVNSGRSTREHNIEDTAVSTNLEAAEEIARQLRLRDLAGLIVIDFIDMEENRNNRAVERKLNDCLKNDRARIQVGRISHFGLLEMSRQRIRTGVLESSTSPCPHCAGIGLVRSTPSLALHVLRALEESLIKSATNDLVLRTRLETALYILNQKRESLRALELRFGVSIMVSADAHLAPGVHYALERGEPVQPRLIAEPVPGEALAAPALRDAPRNGGQRVIHPEDIEMEEAEEETEEDTTEAASELGQRPSEGEGDGEHKRRRRRRRRGRNGEGRSDEPRENAAPRAPMEGEGTALPREDDTSGEGEDAGEGQEPGDINDNASAEEKRRRRRRRGGRRNRRDREPRDGQALINVEAGEGEAQAEPAAPVMAAPIEAETAPVTEVEAPAKPRRGRAKKADATPPDAEVAPIAAEAEAPARTEAPAKPVRAARGRKPKVTEAEAPEAVVASTPEAPAPVAPAPAPEVKSEPVPVVKAAPPAPEPEVEDPNRPRRTGWWAKAKQALGG